MKFYEPKGFLRKARNQLFKLWKRITNRRPRVFFDISIDGKPAGTITIKLYDVDVPRSAENFRYLCTVGKRIGIGAMPLHFKGCKFFRILPGWRLTGNDGSGGQPIIRVIRTREFQDRAQQERNRVNGQNWARRNASISSVAVVPAPWLDKKRVAIGKVVEGMDAVNQIDRLGSLSGIVIGRASIELRRIEAEDRTVDQNVSLLMLELSIAAVCPSLPSAWMRLCHLSFVERNDVHMEKQSH